MNSQTLADRLRGCGVEPSGIIVHRIALHPDDADESYRTTADLVRTGHALIYERIQDGLTFGADALVAAFIEQSNRTARFAGLRRLVARTPGVAPGDIVYDPEIANLLHNFIARAKTPFFYDAAEDARGEGLRDCILFWPANAGDTLRAHDPALQVAAESAA